MALFHFYCRQIEYLYPLFSLIEKLETETTAKQTNLETLRREKVELENTLEQEQEALVNKLWKRMDQLETGNFIQINEFINMH